jgi:hypothetical protein
LFTNQSAARVRPGLRPNGAHRFHSYNTPPYEIKASEAAVLHYTYARFSDFSNRKTRCACKVFFVPLKYDSFIECLGFRG